MKLYEQTANRISTLLERGTLRPGDRIPSVRRLSRDTGVSQATVLQAYGVLERRGLIEARPQSGYYVRRQQATAAALQASAPRRQATRVDVSELIYLVMEAARDPRLVPLGSPFPAPELAPLSTLNRKLAASARKADANTLLSDLPPGHPELRRQIARRYLASGCAVSEDELIVTCGAMEALNLSLRAVARAGDAIAIESPSFPAMLQAIENLGLKAIEVATHPLEGIDLAELAALIDKHPIKACLLMTTFQNPLGGSMPAAKKRELVALLARHDLPLIEDDVYGDLHFSPHRPQPARAYDRRGLVMHCASFSKSLAPGYRVGWVAAGRYREQIKRLKFMATIATASLPQAAIAEFLAHHSFERHLRHMRQALRTQCAEVTQAVSRHFPPGTRMTAPEGGYMLWVELPERVDALELFQRALERNISIAPGPIFSARRGFRNYIRLNFGQLVTPRTHTALTTLGTLAKTF